MKTILFVLALVAVALAAPADDNSEKKPEKIRERGNTEYDANLKFNWKGDGSWKSRLEGAFKPILDALNALGLKGDLNSESNGKGGGDISGHFRFSGGKRGNGAKSNDAADANTQSSGSDANTAEASSSNGPKSGRSGISSVIEAGQNALGGVKLPEVPQGLSNLSGPRSGRNALPQIG